MDKSIFSTIFCVEKSEFWNIVFYDLTKRNDVFVMSNEFRWKKIKNNNLKYLCRLHHSRTLNSKFDFPLKKCWSRYDQIYEFKSMNVQRVIFTDTIIREYSKSDLLYLKKIGIKLYVIFLNPIASLFDTKRALDYYKMNIFDEAFSVDEEDSKKMGFKYRKYFYSKKLMPKKDLKWKLSFVGNSKNRTNVLNSIAKKVESINSIFYINDVKESEQCHCSNIVYNSYINYNQVLDLVNESECILEILQEGQNAFTFRTYEAICYNKKLITNNKNIVKQPFYNPKYIKVFDVVDDSIIEFINNGELPNYEISNEFSPLNLFKEILAFEKDREKTYE